MLSNIKKRTEGFTIIEVLIVLAIAGLILLIVFLAVPALQRNSRNTQRKNDVSALLGAVSEYSNNNGGSLPGAVTVSGNTAYFCASGTCDSTNGTPAKIGFYTEGNVSISTSSSGAADKDKVQILKGFTCNGNSPASGSGRSLAALYAVEPGDTAQCQGS